MVLTPAGVHHLNAAKPAPMAEIFGGEKVAVAADCSHGDQGSEPAELLSDRQLVGIEDQVGVGADDLEAAQGPQSIGDRQSDSPASQAPARISGVPADRGGRPREPRTSRTDPVEHEQSSTRATRRGRRPSGPGFLQRELVLACAQRRSRLPLVELPEKLA